MLGCGQLLLHYGWEVSMRLVFQHSHTCLLLPIVVTVGTFETAKRRPTFFIRDGYHTPSRSRNMYYNGKKIKLDPNDVGGEHE